MSKKVTLICLVALSVVLVAAVIAGMLISYPDYKIKEKFGQNCEIRETCGDMIYVDCNSAADGPAYYLDKNLQVIGTSGGLCMGGQCSGASKSWIDCIAQKIEDKK